jgi:hypothetical protein
VHAAGRNLTRGVLHTPGGMRRLLVVTLVFALNACPAAASFQVSGSGGNPNVAMDAAGNILVAYKVDTYGPTDAVELCVVPPRKRTCAFRTRVAFPGEGYNINPVGVFISTDGTVVVTTGRADSNGGSVYAATSSDGGRSFRAAVRVADGTSGPTVLTPDGRLGMVSGEVPGMSAAIVRVTGEDANRERPELQDFSQFTSITNYAGGLVATGSDAHSSREWFLAAGADSFNRAAWAELPALRRDRQPQVAGGRAGLGVLLERDNRGLNFRRFGTKGWSRPLYLGAPSYNTGFDLVQDPRGRLFAVWAVVPTNDSRTRIEAAMSTDRGATWSSVARLLRTRRDVYGDNLYAAVGRRGRGALVFFDETNTGLANLGPVQVVRLSPGRIPTSGKRVGKGHLSLRVGADVSCVHERNSTARLQASLHGRRVPVRRFVRGVSFSAAARRLRGGGRFGARYLLRHARTRVRARVVPRHGKAFTLRLPMRACL